jgi:hypothetical protein
MVVINTLCKVEKLESHCFLQEEIVKESFSLRASFRMSMLSCKVDEPKLNLKKA